jgi:hypothetical protein
LKLGEVEGRGLVVVVTAFVVLPGGVDAWKEEGEGGRLRTGSEWGTTRIITHACTHNQS